MVQSPRSVIFLCCHGNEACMRKLQIHSKLGERLSGWIEVQSVTRTHGSRGETQERPRNRGDGERSANTEMKCMFTAIKMHTVPLCQEQT